MNIHSFSGSVTNEIRYKNPGNNFSGIIFYTNLNSNFINGWQYRNGKVVAETRKVTNLPDGRAPLPEEDCYTYQVDIYERTCYYYEDPVINYCTEWQYVGSATYTNCPSEGGGGGGGVSNQTVVTTSVNIEEDELYYSVDDESDAGPTPIKYSYNYQIGRTEPGRQVVSVVMFPITASPMVTTYFSKYLPGVTITRSLTLFSQYNSYSILTATSVWLQWSCTVHGEYAYSNGDRKSRNWHNSYSAVDN